MASRMLPSAQGKSSELSRVEKLVTVRIDVTVRTKTAIMSKVTVRWMSRDWRIDEWPPVPWYQELLPSLEFHNISGECSP